MKCRILKVQRPGMVELFQPQYKGWFLWHNIPKHVVAGVAGVRYSPYYYSIQEAEEGLRKWLSENSVLECTVAKEFEL